MERSEITEVVAGTLGPSRRNILSMHYFRRSSVVMIIFLLLIGCQVLSGAESTDRVAELLNVQEGQSVADVGAGDGEWSFDLARRVGSNGQVFSTEVDLEKLEGVRDQASEQDLHNITPVLAGESVTGLPVDCCDAILIRLVYHHFTQPDAMLNSLRRAIRSSGRIVIIDFEPGRLDPVPGVPENRGGHGVDPELVIQEMTAAGFTLSQRIDSWDDREDRFCLVFDAP